MPVPDFDSYVLEHASKPSFWALGFLTIGMFVASILSPRPPSLAKRPNQSKRVAGPQPVLEPHFTSWLAPRLTSRGRQGVAVVAYAAILGLAALEIYWVVVTGFRWGGKLFRWWPADEAFAMEGDYWKAVAYLLFLTAGTAICGGAILTVLASCIYELVYLAPVARTKSIGKGRKEE